MAKIQLDRAQSKAAGCFLLMLPGLCMMAFISLTSAGAGLVSTGVVLVTVAIVTPLVFACTFEATED